MLEEQPRSTNLKHEHGPFDIIGDVHGCFAELKELLVIMGYIVEETAGPDGKNYRARHPGGRRAVFLGDLVDRGPNMVDALKLVMNMVKSGNALCVCGNHELRVLKKIQEGNVLTSHGDPDWSMGQLTRQSAGFLSEVQRFMEGLVSHYVLDDGKLVVAHAGIKEALQGIESEEVRTLAIYGELTSETDEYGLPVRYEWAADYRGMAIVVYGHTPQSEVQKVNNAINIDTGCVFGGKLTAFRYPEGVFMEVSAPKIYCPPAKPFLPHHDRIKTAARVGCAMYDVQKPAEPNKKK